MHEVTQPRSSRGALTEVIGELTFDEPIDPGYLASIDSSCRWCFETYRVQLVRTFVSRNRKRAVLVFRAPDAESVRSVLARVALPFERVWTAGPED